MSSITVTNVGKAYKRYSGKWARILEWLTFRSWHKKTWVLHDINFTVQPGEAVGIIGLNGAGKSTLLKIITGTTKPTTGSVHIQGRVAALLELGMGFHPDFTGRQNVLIAGQLLGLRAEEVAGCMPSIEAFAEIGEYIDRPVRVYSSGMQMRLAFSVATAVRPDVLIIDEALSVGDTYFQHKSFNRIRQFRDQGTTLLFVSHGPGTIKTLCDRAILLDHGVMVRDGIPDNVLDYYNAIIAKQQADQEIREIEIQSGKNIIRSGNQDAVIEGADLKLNGQSVRAVRIGEAVSFELDITIQQNLEELTVGILIRDRLGNDVFGTNTWHLGCSEHNLQTGQRWRIAFDFPELNLGVGSYSVTFALHSSDTHVANNYDWWNQALVFQVVPGEDFLAIGVSYLPTQSRWLVA